LIVSPSTTSMGVVMKIYSVFVVALSLYMFLYKLMKEKMVSYIHMIKDRSVLMSCTLGIILDCVS